MPHSMTNSIRLPRPPYWEQYRIVWLGCGMGALYWIFESTLHVFVLNDGDLLGQILTPRPHEIYKRLLFVFTLTFFSLYVQVSVSRLKRLKDNLAKREEEFYLILDNNPVGIVLVDTESRCLTWANKHSLDLIGSSKDRIEGKVCHNHLCPAERGKCPILDCGQSMDLTERTLITAGGKKIPIFKSTRQVTFKGKDHLLEAFIDLSERKEMETALQLANIELDQIFQTASVGMRVIDKNFDVVRMNRTLSVMCGVNPEKGVGKKCYDTFSGKACFSDQCPVNLIFDGGRHVSSVTEKIRLDGQVVPCILSATPFLGSNGEILGIVESFKDISEITRARAAEASERNRLKRILANLNFGVGILNREYRLEYHNAILDSYFGDSRNRYCYEMFHERSQPCENCLMASVFEDGKIHQSEFNNSKERIYQCMYIPFTDVDGREEVLVLFEDVTDQHVATLAMMRAEQLAALGEMAAGIAHEINNPISAIINYGQMIMNKSDSDGRIHQIASLVRKEGDRIARIVEGMLSFARCNDENKKPVAVQTIIDDALALVSAMLAKDKISIEVSVPDASLLVRAQAQEIEQVLVNLISNARYALNNRYGSENDKKRILISAVPTIDNDEPFIELCVLDNGTGIPPAILDKVMNPFFTSKPEKKRTGLGLSISHGIIEDHGGRLRIDSREQEYTKIFLTLPAHRKT